MAKIRIIHCINDDNEENVYLTEDFEMPASDVLYPGYTVHSDEVCELELPGSFPLEYTLQRM